MISEIMNTYQNTLENLTVEITNLRSEVADQKQQLKNRFKVLSQQQTQQEQRIDQQLQTYQQRQQQQQHQLRNQLKQQMESFHQVLQPSQPAKLNIQYETIQCPKVKQQSPDKNKSQSKHLESHDVKVRATEHQPTPPKTHSLNVATATKENEMRAKQNSYASSKLANSAAGSSKALLKPTLFPPPKEKRKPRKIYAMILGSSIVKHVQGRKIKKKRNICQGLLFPRCGH